MGASTEMGLYAQGKYAYAIPIAKNYVALARNRYGELHTEFAVALSWLAAVYLVQTRYAEAEPLYKPALAIEEKAPGPSTPPSPLTSTTSPRSMAPRAATGPQQGRNRAATGPQPALGRLIPDDDGSCGFV
jgi:tetratricopeptide (TPR) repeat protein